MRLAAGNDSLAAVPGLPNRFRCQFVGAFVRMSVKRVDGQCLIAMSGEGGSQIEMLDPQFSAARGQLFMHDAEGIIREAIVDLLTN